MRKRAHIAVKGVEDLSDTFVSLLVGGGVSFTVVFPVFPANIFHLLQP